MTIETAIYAALHDLVGHRVTPVMFPQPPNRPTWPAIRYTLFSNPIVDVCGDGDDDTTEQHVQLDVVDVTFDGARSLRLSVMERMRAFAPPATLEDSRDTFDTETKTYREILTYFIHGSTAS